MEQRRWLEGKDNAVDGKVVRRIHSMAEAQSQRLKKSSGAVADVIKA